MVGRQRRGRVERVRLRRLVVRRRFVRWFVVRQHLVVLQQQLVVRRRFVVRWWRFVLRRGQQLTDRTGFAGAGTGRRLRTGLRGPARRCTPGGGSRRM
ncbi:hypothetical protein [Streptomyces meridianus]|uniref:Uncharacterized protein n=1 Tax=Streptomyces meridianus TaxID=2938945 RepID=A0ABT0X5E5_9ACTN|nr:hypothetical protein [Streptomyces meridianus]MCM2577765.1 hypothetical protein [Streptomyces meridianus]